ncbi:MAG: hypothetical protein IPP77_13190 [Bacteroidetes bacterium]|nr:hypothetical protein [Bacteroidota bacterium]
MASKNVFKLSPVHEVINDFCEQQERSIKTYQESYKLIESFEATLRSLTDTKNLDLLLKESAVYFQKMDAVYREMGIYFNEFILFYYSFREVAKDNEAVANEFRKLPKDFTPIQEQFNLLLKGYERSLGEFGKLL